MKTNTRQAPNGEAELRSRQLSFWVEPADAFSSIAHVPGSVLLESQPSSAYGRYSILCTMPFGLLQTLDGRTTVHLPGRTIEASDSPFDMLNRLLSLWSHPSMDGFTFAGGAVGYLGYELLSFVEQVPVLCQDDLGLPDCRMGLYNCAAVFDHLHRTISLNSICLPGMTDPDPCLGLLEQAITEARDSGHVPYPDRTRSEGQPPHSSFTRADYCDAVRRIKDYIAAGDVYQVNLSQRFSVPLAMESWDLYLRLRQRNPAPYAAYLNADGFQVVSSSPECFLTYDAHSRIVETRPIKGTRPRGADPIEDERLAAELAASEKDNAENVMIVDLERNDLGRVSEFGSVSVPELAAVESHPTVHHLVSKVTGRLRQDRGPVDLLRACFPGGSITGAPKIRAMEIIEEIEPVRRGVYTGSIGYIGFDGSVNLSIAIRTAIVKDGMCHFHVGGGIVADSDPDMEYRETLDKGRAFFEVLGCLTSI